MWMGRKTTLLGALFPDYCEILLLIKLKKKIYWKNLLYYPFFFFDFLACYAPLKKRMKFKK
jgi:hypothetical protein